MTADHAIDVHQRPEGTVAARITPDPYPSDHDTGIDLPPTRLGHANPDLGGHLVGDERCAVPLAAWLWPVETVQPTDLL